MVPKSVTLAVSTINDGSMLWAASDEELRDNRSGFLLKNGISINNCVRVTMQYDKADFCQYFVVSGANRGEGMTVPLPHASDALFTKDKNLALFLPVADCVAAMLYDELQKVLGLAHFGRHNLEQHGGMEVVRFMKEEFNTDPNDLRVWLSPAAGGYAYPLFSFDNRSLHEVAVEQLLAGGVTRQNIEIDTRDTTSDPALFSHSEYLKGKREQDGRQAVVAMMR